MKKRILCILLTILSSPALIGCSCFTLDASRFIDLPRQSEPDPDNESMPEQENSDGIGEIFCSDAEPEHLAFSDHRKYADNEVLIVVKEDASRDDVQQLAERYDAEIVGTIEITGDYQLRLPNALSINELESLADTLRSESIVEDAYVNYYTGFECQAAEDHTRWDTDLENAEDMKGLSWGAEAIRAPQAWKLLRENRSKVQPVRLGLIDNGFFVNHEDLRDCFAETFYNYDESEISRMKEDEMEDKLSHGTHVAGIMAANSDNRRGIYGIYPYGAYDGGTLYGASFVKVKTQYIENSVSCIKEKCCYAELIVRNVKVINCSYAADSNIVELYHIQKELKQNAGILQDFLLKFIKKGYDFVIVQGAGNYSNKQYTKLKCGDDEKPIADKNGKVSYDENGEYCEVFYHSDNMDHSVGEKMVEHSALGAVIQYLENGWYYQDGDTPRKVSNLSGSPHDERIRKFGYRNAEYTSLMKLFTDDELKNRVIVVGAVEKDDKYGLKLCEFSNCKSFVDVYAPGSDIDSSVAPKGNTLYKQMGGTSVAAPHVAGLAAGVWAANRGLTGPEVREIVCSTADSKTCTMISAGENVPVELKIVNMEAAVRSALGLEPKPVKEEPAEGSILCWVVEKGSEDKIIGARVTASDAETGEEIQMTGTDNEGHFELVLPPGKYILTVTDSEGKYEVYTSDVIEVQPEKVNYLKDWIKLTRKAAEMSGYLGTGLDGFLAKFTGLKKVDVTDGTLEYSNDKIIVSALPDDRKINFIEIKGKSDYKLYGLEYGMPFSNAEQSVTQPIVSVSDNQPDYKMLRLDHDITLSFHADANGLLDAIMVSAPRIHSGDESSAAAETSKPDTTAPPEPAAPASSPTYYDLFGCYLEHGYTTIVENGSPVRADMTGYALVDYDQDNEKEFIAEYDVIPSEIGRYLICCKSEGVIISEHEPQSMWHVNSVYKAPDGNGIMLVGYSSSYWIKKLIPRYDQCDVIAGWADQDAAKYEQELNRYIGEPIVFHAPNDPEPLYEELPPSLIASRSTW